MSAGMLASAKGTPVLNRNRRLLLWWSQQKKDVNDVNLQFDNGQSGHGPPRGGAWADFPLGSATAQG